MESGRTRCGVDTVEIARIERLLRQTPAHDLAKLFSAAELCDSGDGAGRAAALAARFAAKEACLKLFPREAALGTIGPSDFHVVRNGYGAPELAYSATAAALLARHRLAAIALSLTHDKTSAAAVAVAEPMRTEVPLLGKLTYHALPFRRRVMRDNLRRVFGQELPEGELTQLAQAHCAHLVRFVAEFVGFACLSAAQRAARVRVENKEACLRAQAQGRGVLLLTGHFGNWEIATVGGIANFPEYRGRFHILRRPLWPRALDALVTRRFRQAGLGVLPKKGALEAILDRLGAGDAVAFVMDQHAGGRDGVAVDFFGHRAWTFRSLAVIALSTGAPVVPVASWREADGRHVLRFEEALPPVQCSDPKQAIYDSTRAYNAALERLVLRHPEQWFWVHRRWKAR
ncbi:MAG: 4'-phosphopantetheinyl transferase superfamily protein [Deltaproteobacteria bacterium]|nr:4'-phosphopantetheinyl transferase superfamily protein [Deltaproteobacteria bacterium]